MEKLQEVKKFAQHIYEYRTAREDQWKKISEWVAPHRGVFTGEEMAPSGRVRNEGAFTNVATQALKKGASGITSGMTPRNISWFEPDFEDEQMIEASGARAYLDELDMRMKNCLERGGFYQAIHNFNTDLLWAGCALLYSEPSEKSVLRFECIQVGTFAIQLDNDGLLDAVVRNMAWTPARIASVFGRDALPEYLKNLLEKNPYELIRVTHMVRRRDWRDPKKMDSTNMPWESFFWEEKGEKFLHEGGYHEMPYFFTSWYGSTTPYGTGPGDAAYLDSRQLDELERDKLRGIGKMVAPPMQADTTLKGIVRLGRNDINYVDGQKTITPILDMRTFGTSLQYLQAEEQVVGDRIRNELMASTFASVPFDQRPKDMSATEFLERKREALQELGPVMSAYEPNVLTPLLHRVLNTLDREGMLPIPPESLKGYPLFLKMDFISPMANALRQTGAEATRALMQEVGALVQMTGSTEVLDKIDVDQAIDEVAYGLGAPGRVVRADADVEAIRQQRAQQQMALQQMQMAVAQSQANANNAASAADMAGAAESMNNMDQGEM